MNARTAIPSALRRMRRALHWCAAAFVAFGVVARAAAQAEDPLVLGEFFWDIDPGQGAATPMAFPANDFFFAGTNGAPPFAPAISNLSPGLHVLGVRVRDAGGDWSDTMKVAIQVQDANAMAAAVARWPDSETNEWLVAAEYWWDTDPGVGLGVGITLTPSDFSHLHGTSAPPFAVSLASLVPGTHRLGLRMKNTGGDWSDTLVSPIEIRDANAIVAAVAQWPDMDAGDLIVGGEYFFDGDPDIGNGTPFTNTARHFLNPGSDGVAPLSFNVSALPLGTHSFGYRVRDASGRWSETIVAAFSLEWRTDWHLASGNALSGGQGDTAGVAWGDYNRDGWPDVFAANGSTAFNLLYRNTTLGDFFSIPGTQAVTSVTGGAAGAWGDFDNDGYLDLFVPGASGSPAASRLFRNNRAGSFLLVTNAGVATNLGSCLGAAWGDFNRDGWLDLVIASAQNGAMLFQNSGGTFSYVSNAFTVAGHQASAVAWCDFNNDGYLDLAVAGGQSGPQVTLLYSNRGDGTFTNLSGPFSADAGYGRSVSWADYDNDGFFDLFVVNGAGGTSRLYRNNGNGSFTRQDATVLQLSGGNQQASLWGDFDKDGFSDVLIVNASGAPVYFRNAGDGTFSTRANALTSVALAGPFGGASGDFDRDGDLDVLLSDSAAGPNQLILNDGDAATWLAVRCVSAGGSPAAIGARVSVRAAIESTNVWQHRQIGGGGGATGQDNPEAFFGLGSATNVAEVRVNWPGGGLTVRTNVPVNQFLTLFEPTLRPAVVAQGRGTLTLTTNLLQLTMTMSATGAPYAKFVRWSDGNTNAVRTIALGTTNIFTAIFTNLFPLETLHTRQWERSFGGTSNDQARVVRAATDGGWLVGGESSSDISGNKESGNFGAEDYWILKLDGQGVKQWERVFGGTERDTLSDAWPTPDGGWLLAGISHSGVSGNKTNASFGNGDWWIIKVNAQGGEEWQRTLGGSGLEAPAAIRPALDGTFVLGGFSGSGDGNKTAPLLGAHDYWLLKMDLAGNVVWQQAFGGDSFDTMLCLEPAADGGFFLGGKSNSGATGNMSAANFGDDDFWLVKVNAFGAKQWEQSYGGASYDALNALVPTATGGCLLVGNSYSPVSGNKTSPARGGSDGWVVSVDGAGDILWQQALGGAGDDFVTGVHLATDGGFVVGGYSSAAGNYGSNDWWSAKIDHLGSNVWEQGFGGEADDQLHSLHGMADGQVLFAGCSLSGVSSNKTAPFFGEGDVWLNLVAERVSAPGVPLVLVNGQYSPSNHFSLLATEIPFTVTMLSSFPEIYFTDDGGDPLFATPYGAPLTYSSSITIRSMAADGFLETPEGDPVRIDVVPLLSVAAIAYGGGTTALNPPGGIYLSNSTVTLTATPSNGWTFMYWTGDVVSVNSSILVTNNRSRTFQAVFGTTITVVSNVNGAILLDPPGGPYPFGSSVRVSAVPAAGRYFRNWTSAPFVGVSNSPVLLPITLPQQSVSATFPSGPPGGNYSLVLNAIGQGTVSKSPLLWYHASGSTVSVTATPDPGWAFLNWSGDTNTTLNPLGVVMNAHKSITATFAPVVTNNPPPEVTITSPASGAVFTNPATVLFTANATDSDGVARVEFFDGATLIGVITNAGGSFAWTNAAVRSHTLTARAFDVFGAASISAPVLIHVHTAIPAVAIFAPAANSIFEPPVDLTLTATASDQDGTIAVVEFMNGTNVLGVISNGVNGFYSMVWSNAPLGRHILRARATDNLGTNATSAPSPIDIAISVTNPPVFWWSNAVVEVGEESGSVTLILFKSANSAQVPASIGFQTRNGSANAEDFFPASGTLNFAANETMKSISIPLVQDNYVESNHFFFVDLSLPTAGSISNASTATVTILDDDIATTNSVFLRFAPGALPSPLATLRVDLSPTNVGQWRFVWENSWHDGGASVAGLPPGNYEIQFKPVSGYVEPLATYVAVITNTLNAYTFVYSNTTAPQLGSLVVNINPAYVATNGNPNERGQWRRTGEGVWHDSGETVDALPAGTHVIEFKLLTAGSWQTPSAQEVTVLPNQLNSALGEYFVANPTPGFGPGLLPFSDVQSTLGFQRGYQFVGQLLTPLGWGSGTVVKERVVLTAAHVVFDDYALAYVPSDSVKWFFQRQAGEYEPAPQTPRGWVVSSGYAAQRQVEASPGLASTATRALDVAALYFGEAAGRGGFSGYLVSRGDLEWLHLATVTTLAGYPVEGIPAQDRGKMHYTGEHTVFWNPVTNQVYATTNIKSYPGNSGGPILVQLATNVNYWPAAVYLGGSGNTVVRAIDDLAVTLINTAEVLGIPGSPNTGGEPPRRATDCPTCSPLIYGTLEVSLNPTNIGALGGGYRFKNATNGVIYREPFNRFFVLANVPWTIEFLPAPYTIAPSSRTITTTAGHTNRTTGLYKSWGQLTFSDGNLRVLGSSSAVYRIDFKPDLTTNVWMPVRTQTLTGAGLTLTNLVPGASNGFFRAVLLP